MTGNGFGIDMDALRDGVRALRDSLVVMEGHTMTDLTALQDIAATDQLDTAVRGIGAAVARHYTTLTEAGMSRKHAALLCRDLQEQWLAAVLPLNPDAALLMGEMGDA